MMNTFKRDKIWFISIVYVEEKERDLIFYRNDERQKYTRKEKKKMYRVTRFE